VHEPAYSRVQWPPPAQRRDTVYARTLLRACEVLGGLDAAARHFGVPAATIARWIEGAEPPPLEVFLAAVDVVLLGGEPGAGRG
jgi:hypothetical protein